MCAALSSLRINDERVEIKTKYIAVDIGNRNCKVCIMNADGSIALSNTTSHIDSYKP